MEDTKPITQNLARNFSKSRGIDISLLRRIREEKQCQVRKEKRNFKTNMERRKFKIDSNKPEADQLLEDKVQQFQPQRSNDIRSPVTTTLRNFGQLLIGRCEDLQSDNASLQIDAATYFRRILAFDRHPPLDAIYENGTVIPRLIHFLCFSDNPSLQLEAAWSLTNFACGDAYHVKHMIDNGAVPQLFNAITSTNSMNVKEQCLWALSNMSADGYGCDCLTAIPNILVPIMGFIGIVLSPSMVVDVTFPDRQMHSFSATHIAGFKDYPSLSVMRHVSMILGNFVRCKTFHESGLVGSIIFAFSDLIRSPDDEVILDICSSLLYVCQLNNANLFQQLLEQGLLSRLKELLEIHYNLLCHANGKTTATKFASGGATNTNSGGGEGSSSSSSRSIYEVCLLCVANITRSPMKLHRHSALLPLAYNTSTTNIFQSSAAGTIGMSPLAHIMEFLSTLLSASNSIASAAVPPAPVVVSENDLDCMQTEQVPVPAAVVVVDSKSADARELFVALLSVFETHEQYILDALSLGVIAVLKVAISNGSYDIKTEAGFCVCAIISIDGSYFDGSFYFEVAGMLHGLLTSNDTHLLMNVLLSFERLFNLAMINRVYSIQCTAQVKDAVEYLANHHPVQEIVDISDRIERLLNMYCSVALEGS